MSNYEYPDAGIIIFARNPEPGKVKTRLLVQLGEDQVTELYVKMLSRTVTMVLESRLAPVFLYVHPAPEHPLFEKFTQLGVQTRQQRGIDLGERMLLALDEILALKGRAVLIGSDCPVMDTAYLTMALKKLEEYPLVLGPAEDGGYVLVGQTELVKSMFNDMPWGSKLVLQKSRECLHRNGVMWTELETLWDVDRPSDLLRPEVMELMRVKDLFPNSI